VVDVYDALIYARPHRPAWTKQAARDYIQDQAGILFDPQVAKMFLKISADYQ
jgi:response regulator RpfG family c-di-GMP phosphodiesterase